MLCLTSADKNLDLLLDRLTMYRSLFQEVRLDLLKTPMVPSEWPIDPKNLLITCRPRSEGGGYTGSEAQRLGWLKSALLGCPGWLDLELDVEKKAFDELYHLAKQQGTKVLVSKHVYTKTSKAQICEWLYRLQSVQADAIKLAVRVEDASELLALLEQGALVSKPKLILGMGPAGSLSRMLYRAFGSLWTYVTPQETSSTAPGQLSLQKAQAWRLTNTDSLSKFALVGGPQIDHSPGPRVYNALFSKNDIPALYLPIMTTQAEVALELLRRLDFKGASVTMPLKTSLGALLYHLGPEAKQAGSVNTLVFQHNKTCTGHTTDGHGAIAALEKKGIEIFGKKAVVLGNGGTAAAIAERLLAQGAQVNILGRDRAKAALLANRLSAHSGFLGDLDQIPFDLLFQCTPLGSQAEDPPLVEEPSCLRKKVVLDAVLNKGTKLITEAKQASAVTIDGYKLWVEQGRLQLKQWLGLDIEAQSLEQFL